jgi:hypothetical protein
MAEPNENDDRERRVASGFPDPADVPGPTEQLRKLHGQTATEPKPPKFGRASASTAGSDDYVPIDEMLRGSSGFADDAADRVASFARKVGDETVARLRDELDKRGVAAKAKAAGIGAGEMGLAGALGVAALGAGTAAMIAGLSRVMPVWTAALVTAGAFGIPAGLLSTRGLKRVRAAMALTDSPAGA